MTSSQFFTPGPGPLPVPRRADTDTMKVLHVLDHSLPHYDGYAFRSWEIIRFERANGIETVQVTSPKHAGAKAAVEQAEGLEFHRTASLGGLYSLPLLDPVGAVLSRKRRLRSGVAASSTV